MSQWIPQSSVSSISPTAQRRTAYLAPVEEEVSAAIDAYLIASPDGEQVTLAVLKALGQSRLNQVRGTRTFGRVKQDVGLLVAQTLVVLYGPSRVETSRRADGKSASTRRNHWPDLGWVGSYTPHRLLPQGSGPHASD